MPTSDRARSAIDELKLYLDQRFAEQNGKLESLATFKSDLDYLKSEVAKQSKFNWRSVAMSVFTSAGINMRVDKQTGQQLFAALMSAVNTGQQFLLPR